MSEPRTEERHPDIPVGKPVRIGDHWYAYTGYVLAQPNSKIKEDEIVDADGKIFREINLQYRKSYLRICIRKANQELIQA